MEAVLDNFNVWQFSLSLNNTASNLQKRQEFSNMPNILKENINGFLSMSLYIPQVELLEYVMRGLW